MTEQVFETYHGDCHCGAFKFSVRLPELKQVVACNCSICSKVLPTNSLFMKTTSWHADYRPLQKGYLWAFPSSDDLFVVEKGHDTLKDYQFGKKTMSHKVRLKHPPSSCAWPLPIKNTCNQVLSHLRHTSHGQETCRRSLYWCECEKKHIYQLEIITLSLTNMAGPHLQRL